MTTKKDLIALLRQTFQITTEGARATLATVDPAGGICPNVALADTLSKTILAAVAAPYGDEFIEEIRAMEAAQDAVDDFVERYHIPPPMPSHVFSRELAN